MKGHKSFHYKILSKNTDKQTDVNEDSGCFAPQKCGSHII